MNFSWKHTFEKDVGNSTFVIINQVIINIKKSLDQVQIWNLKPVKNVLGVHKTDV